MSREDRIFMKILQEGTKPRNNPYQVFFPFKDPYVNRPKNSYQGSQRFLHFEKKFSPIVFVGASLPSCCSFVLRITAKDNEQQFDQEVTQILEVSFYVEDLLKGFPTVKKAVNKIKQPQ